MEMVMSTHDTVEHISKFMDYKTVCIFRTVSKNMKRFSKNKYFEYKDLENEFNGRREKAAVILYEYQFREEIGMFLESLEPQHSNYELFKEELIENNVELYSLFIITSKDENDLELCISTMYDVFMAELYEQLLE